MLRTLTFLAGVALALGSTETLARQVCGPRVDMLAGLARVHGERPIAVGLASDGTVVEILSSNTGSWTVLFTRPDGRTCVIDYGQGWQTIEVGVETDGGMS